MDLSKPLSSLIYNGPLFILGIFCLFFRKQEYTRLQIITDPALGSTLADALY